MASGSPVQTKSVWSAASGTVLGVSRLSFTSMSGRSGHSPPLRMMNIMASTL